jgi:F-type H+-transporting ATPase subunit c
MEGLQLSAVAASLVTIGAAYGISKIGKAAMEAIARQPEAAQSIRTGMIIAAALIEGIAFFCGVICIIK